MWQYLGTGVTVTTRGAPGTWWAQNAQRREGPEQRHGHPCGGPSAAQATSISHLRGQVTDSSPKAPPTVIAPRNLIWSLGLGSGPWVGLCLLFTLEGPGGRMARGFGATQRPEKAGALPGRDRQPPPPSGHPEFLPEGRAWVGQRPGVWPQLSNYGHTSCLPRQAGPGPGSLAWFHRARSWRLGPRIKPPIQGHTGRLCATPWPPPRGL